MDPHVYLNTGTSRFQLYVWMSLVMWATHTAFCSPRTISPLPVQDDVDEGGMQIAIRRVKQPQKFEYALSI